MGKSLTKSEAADLARLESVVDAGLQTFVEVGLALAEIRDSRLYRESHGDFDTYCRERWGWSKTQSNRLIGAASVVETMKTDSAPMGVIPTNERQARELIPVPAEKRGEVMQEAAKIAAPKPPSARDVKEAAKPYVPMAERLERAEKAAAAKARREANRIESAEDIAAKLTAPKTTPPSVAVPPRPSEAESETPDEPRESSTGAAALIQPEVGAPTGVVSAESESARSDTPVVTPAVREEGAVSLPAWLSTAIALPKPGAPLTNAEADALDEATCAHLDTVWVAIKQAVARARARRHDLVAA